MSEVQIETHKIHGSDSVRLKVGGIRIEMSIADYQAMLAAVDADIAELHRVATNRERSALDRVKKSYAAADELRSIIYEGIDGEFFMLREKPDNAALTVFIDKYQQLMGFE